MEGKKKYFALVLFLFLGLMIFTFANPVEEEKEFVDGDKEQSETINNNKDNTTNEEQTTEENEETTTGQEQTNVLNNVTNNANNNNGNNNNNNGNAQNREDNSLEQALAAVEKAEASYTTQDVKNAQELVNNVTDTTEKGKLQNRLDEVEAGIAVLELIENLESQVENAEEKADMTTATTYRDENEIAAKIEELTNETVAEELAKRLAEVSKLLDDNAAPTVNVEAKGYTTNVTITAEDEAGNAFTLYLTKDNGEEVEIENNTATTSEGIYVLRVVDEAFNEATVRFVVDGTDPVLKGLTNGGHYDKVTIDAEDLSEVTIKVTNMDTNETTEVENGTVLTEEATYKIVVTDEANNTTTYWVAIDKTAPTITGVTNNSIVNKSENAYIRDKFLTLVRVTAKYADGTEKVEEFTRADFTVGARNENFEYKYRATKEGTYTIYAEDKYGNNYSETFTIDRTAAELVSANMYSNGNKYTEVINDKEHQVYYTTNGDTITAYIRVSEQLKDVPSFTFEVGDTLIATTDVTEAFHKAEDEEAGIYRYQTTLIVDEYDFDNGDIKLTVSDIIDKAGNQTADVTSVTNKNIVRIDRTEAARVYSTIRSKANQVVHENGNDIDFYHKNGTEFEYAISFNELLAEAPTVTIAGREVEMKLNEKVLNNENKFLYEGTFKIAENEAELTEGTLEIKVTNIKDLAGNETVLADQTKTSNGRRVIYDRTAATRKSADFYVNGLTQVDKTFYTKYGKTLVVNITTDEELKEVPTFTLHNNGKDYVIEGAVYRGLNDKGYHLYQASYEIKEDSGMTDGEITFTVSNITDRAGNTTDNVTEATNGRKVVLDTEVEVDKLAIIGKNGQWKDKEYIQYANTGTTVYVNARFKEELAETPVVTLNDKITLTKATKKLTNGIWIYSYSYQLVENDGLEDGTIQVKVTNIKDFAGNTTELTNEHMTLESQSEVVVDRTLPTFRFTKAGSSLAKDEITPIEKDGVYYFNQNVRVSLSDAVNLRLHGVDTYYDDKNAKRTGWLTDVKTDGEHTAVAEDAAGNRLEFKFVIDTTAPVIDEGEDLTLEAGKDTVPELKATVTDNFDGTWTVEPAYINRHNDDETIDRNVQIDINKPGKYNVVFQAKDMMGNEATQKSKIVYVVDTTEAEIVLPGQEGTNKNEYRILKDSHIALDYLEAKVTDNVDSDTTILPTKFYAYYPKATGIASGVYTLKERVIDQDENGQDIIQKYFDTSMVGVNYEVQYEYTDKAGNKTKKSMLLIVDAPYNPTIENNTIDVKYDLTLNDKPFYNDKTRTEDLTINGNGKTITQEIDTEYKYTWDITGTRPMQSNMFTSANGSKVTVNDLTFKGTMYSMTLGHYRTSNQAGFNTELNNVNMINTEVASFSAGISPAVTVYGTAVLNNTNIYGTKLSALDTNPQWPVYDLAVVHNTNTTINGGKIGTIYTWAKAYLEINNAEIDTITSNIEYRSDFKNAHLVIGENTKVNKIIVKENKAVITIKATATVDTLDISAYDESTMTFNIEPGATINTVITKDGTMTYEEWYKLITTKEKLATAVVLGGDLTFKNDITLSAKESLVIPAETTVKMNLNGKTLTNKVSGGAALINNGTLTLTGNGSIVNGASDVEKSHTLVNNGTLVIENGTYGNDESAGITVVNNGTATINGGTFKGRQESKKGEGKVGYIFVNNADGVMTINDATVNGKVHGLFGAYAGQLIVNGGTYTLDGNNGLGCYVAYSNGKGKVFLNDGTIYTNKPRNNHYFYIYIASSKKGYFDGAATNTGWIVADEADIYLDGVKLPY